MDHTADGPSEAGTRPLLAVLHDLGAASAMQITASARGLCEVVFLADRALPHVAEQLPLMRELAEVVDITGLTQEQVCERTAAPRPSGVTSFAERRIVGAAALARHCGTPGHGAAVAEALTDKLRQREVLAERGVQSTACAPLYGADDVTLAAARTGFPAILKPRHGAGSVDTCRVESVEQCTRAARQFNVGPDRPFVLEELLPDGVARTPLSDYVSVESVVQDGRITTLGITGTFPLAPPYRETGKALPATVSGDEAERVTALAERAVTALGVRDGMCHTEVKLTPRGPRIVEVNGRLGGWIGELMQRATGVDLVRMTMAVALGLPVAAPHPGSTPGHVVYQRFVMPAQGSREVVSVAPLARLGELPGVDWVETRVREGQSIDWRRGSLQQLAVVRGSVADHGALPELLAATERAAREACR